MATIPRSPGRGSQSLSLAVLGSALGLWACDSGSFQGELPPCRCEVETCSTQSCPIEVSFDGTCVGEISIAEVMVDGHVEEDAVTANARLTTCSRIEPGQSATIWVRGGPWIWGPLVESCTTPRETRTLILQCVEAQ